MTPTPKAPSVQAELPDLAPVIQWLEAGCNVGDAAKELRLHQATISQAKAAMDEQAAQLSRLQAGGGEAENGPYGWYARDGKQHDTGRVTVNGGSYFADTASPQDARLIAEALNASLSNLPAAPALVPLTDEQVKVIRDEHFHADIPSSLMIEVTRAIERAHGINGLTVGGDGGAKG